MKRLVLLAAMFAAAVPGSSVAAQGAPAMVSAGDPQGVAAAMRYAGYPAELKTDRVGDPMIETEFAGYRGGVYFYGCDEDTHTNCQSLQLGVGFDRAEPMDMSAANAMVAKYRFASVHLDDEGDPWVQFDIVTLDGIPAPVFLKALDHFSWSTGEIGDAVFAEEGE